MMTTKLCRALVGLAAVAAITVFAAPAVFAQPAPPAENPKCGSVAGLMHHSLAAFAGGAVGRNFVSIPRVSPINGSPTNQSNNGFHKICDRMGLSAPPSGQASDLPDIDGDAVPDNAALLQYDAKNGNVNTYTCNQVISSAQWDEGSGLEIRPSLSNSSSVSLIIPGVECSQRYAVYEAGNGFGINYFSIPLTTVCSERNCLCGQLNLPNGTRIQTNFASAGQLETFLCGQVDTFTRGTGSVFIPTGEAARIEPLNTGLASPGQPMNCLSGPPCPATPSSDYPATLIY